MIVRRAILLKSHGACKLPKDDLPGNDVNRSSRLDGADVENPRMFVLVRVFAMLLVGFTENTVEGETWAVAYTGTGAVIS